MNPNVNPTADISNDQSTMVDQGYELVKDWHDGCTPGSDGCGFMNCPRFCENTDRATCYGDFVVPTVDQSGYYTFVWYWIFNPGSPYISCFEAYIDAEATTDTSDDTDADAFDESPGSVYDGQSVSKYLTQMPICIENMEYDADQMSNFVCNQFGDEVDCDDIEIIDVSTDTDSYNFTAQIYHDTASSTITSIAWGGTTEDESEFCQDLEQLYSVSGNDVSCTNCIDTVTYALYTSDASGQSLFKLFLGMVAAMWMMM